VLFTCPAAGSEKETQKAPPTSRPRMIVLEVIFVSLWLFALFAFTRRR
jgi:hypothetical protein